jgi:hypothetical protein
MHTVHFLRIFLILEKLKSSLRAAEDKHWGRMRPAGRQFDMPVVEDAKLV